MKPVEHTQAEVVWTRATRALLPFASYATATADGAVIALAADDEVTLVRLGGDAATVENVPGSLIAVSTPLIATPGPEVGVVVMRDVARGLEYRVPSAVGGIEWTERTAWRAADDTLIRAITSKTVQAGRLHGYAPGDPAPRWQVELAAGVADAVVVGDRVIVQLTDGRGHAELAAFDVRDGRAAWRVATGATYFDQGALAVSGGTVATVLAGTACEVCEKVELHDVATGALVRTVALDGPSILASLGPRGVETEVGLTGDELWVRFHRLGSSDGGFHELGRTPNTCTFTAFDLRTGASRPATGAWATELAACEAPMLLAPIEGGLVAVRHDETKLEVARLSSAP